MSTLHPPIERLADLVDGTPTLFEREHVATCARCSTELEAYRRLIVLAGDERRRIGPPLTDWESLRSGLLAHGLMYTSGQRRPAGLRVWTQRVASVALLLATGTVAGRVTAGLSWSQAIAVRSQGTLHAIDGLEGIPVSLTSSGDLRTPRQALAQLRFAQRSYEEAASWLSAHDTTSSAGASDQYRTRLAALDMASETFEQALTDAPEDPIINQYYMATMNAREVAIRRLGSTLPASVRMGRF